MLLAFCSVVPAGCSLSYSKLYTSDNVEINVNDSVEVNVSDILQIKEIFYDKNDEKITDFNLSTDELGIVFEPVSIVRSGNDFFNYEISLSNGEIIINLNSTLAGKFKLTGKYLSSKIYYVTFVPGEPSEKSILEVDKNVVNAGEKVTVYIIPYDKYENLINATKFKDSNPFIVSYNNLTSNENICAKNFKITNILTYQIISYEVNLTEAGKITINGKIGNNPLNTRTITVNHLEMDFIQSKIYHYYSNNTEKDLINEDVEKNNETEPIYRLYPKDKYGNAIEFVPKEKFENLRSYLEYSNHKNLFYNFKLKNEKYTEQRFVEFVINDAENKVNYKNLIYGNYELFFIDESKKLSYNIVLDNGCSIKTPFKCSFGKDIKCAASQTGCGCPEEYEKCDKMPYCVPKIEKENMCPFVGTSYKRVCPIGKVLCADLSCKNNYGECFKYTHCRRHYKRCPDQSCLHDSYSCTELITCENTNDYVCNNKECVKSEIECEESTNSNKDTNN